MLSVIVDARAHTGNLPSLLAQLVAGAVDGLVREVLIVAPEGSEVSAICRETGAGLFDSLGAAAQAARSDQLMLLAAGFRLRDGWLESIADFLGQGRRSAVVEGLDGRRLFRRPARGLLLPRAQALEGVDLDVLRRRLGMRPARVG